MFCSQEKKMYKNGENKQKTGRTDLIRSVLRVLEQIFCF